MKSIKKLKERGRFAMQFITYLVGGRYGSPYSCHEAFITPEHLKRLYLLMHEHIRAEDDRHRLGAYSPDLRDGAQEARQLLIFSGCKLAGLGFLVKGKPGRVSRCWVKRSSSHKAAARTCRIASAPSGWFQNISVPLTR